MSYCAICGILLSEKTARDGMWVSCNACRMAMEETKKRFRIKTCECEVCNRKFDPDIHESETELNRWIVTVDEKKKYSTDDGEKKFRDDLVDEEIRGNWEKEQLSLKKQLLVQDSGLMKRLKQKIDSSNLAAGEMYIGGVDISFIKGDNVNACSAFVVLSFPQLEVVYEDYKMVKLTAPYIPGFLAFREVNFLVEQFRELERSKPEFLPHVIFVDGNGILHPRGFGLASHLGVLLDVATVGVAKTLIHVDGLEYDEDHKNKKDLLKKAGDTFVLKDSRGSVLGKALRSCDNTTNPVYISVGHKISLDTALWLVIKCCKYRIPEPTRKADINSREFLRVNYPESCQA